MKQFQLLVKLVRRWVKSLLAPFGLAVESKEKLSRLTVYGTLDHARKIGVAPNTVIGVGAAYGDWSGECQLVFPSARYLLVEPLEEFSELL